jgi:hypothetical protein
VPAGDRCEPPALDLEIVSHRSSPAESAAGFESTRPPIHVYLRAVEFSEGDHLDEGSLKTLVRDAISYNQAKRKK